MLLLCLALGRFLEVILAGAGGINSLRRGIPGED